ncbi:MAG: tetratricopeptide repeat protein [Crocinitomicaceae bacterium]|nr:tetratricopeptide repeat protein [Crocinitomicaceae bacterium]
MKTEFQKGLDKVNQKDFNSAIEHFTLAIQSDQSKVEFYAERAVAYLNIEQFDLSMFDMNRCIELEPINSYRYACRAFLKSRMGDHHGAIADYEHAVKLDPDDAISYNNLGLVQEALGYMQQAQKSYEKSNKLVGYNPKRFDEGNKDNSNNKEDNSSEKSPNQTEQPTAPLKSSHVAKSVFTTRAGFKDFFAFIKNGFKIKS